jgi:hypothetical protein
MGVALLALALGVVFSRVPFASQLLWAWDSVLYARALENGFHVDFVLSDQRPHPPGYILYVAVAALARAVLRDTNLALVLVSIVAAAFAAIGVFALARRFASPTAALLSACAFAASPLVWLYSEVAYPYTVLACVAVFGAGALWSMRSGDARRAIATSAAFGLLVGFRQDLLLLLAPLWIWAVWPFRPTVRLASAAAAAIGVTIWLAPTVVLSGGIDDYITALVQQADSVRLSYSTTENGMPALATNLATTAYALAWGLAVAALPLAVASVLWLRPRKRVSARAAFFVLWVAPALLFYVAVHIGEWGYVLSIVPAGFVALAIALDRFRAGFPQRAGAALTVVATAASVLAFAFAPLPFSATTIAAHDRALASRVSYVRENFSPRETGVLAREDYLLVQHYLPEFRVMFHDPDPYVPVKRNVRARGITALVVFTSGLSPNADVQIRRIRCARDVEITYVPIPADAVLVFTGNRYAIRVGE